VRSCEADAGHGREATSAEPSEVHHPPRQSSPALPRLEPSGRGGTADEPYGGDSPKIHADDRLSASDLHAAYGNHAGLLRAMGHSEDEVGGF